MDANKIKKESGSKSPKRKIASGIVNIEATFNNTKVNFSDGKGNVLAWASAGSLGFRGAKKGTPFAASKVGETIAEKMKIMGVLESAISILGVGSGREPVIRSVIASGIEISSIKDRTSPPFNGPKAKKPRRV